MYICKFGQNPTTGSEDMHGNEKVDADANTNANGIRTKTIYPTTLRVGGGGGGGGDIISSLTSK